MEDFSEQAIKANCPHCDITSSAFNFTLEQSDNFSIICDANPIAEGHILIIPKQHISCIGAYSDKLFREFMNLNSKVSQFILKEYGHISSFEHGIFGQTVFHSHMHYMPFSGSSVDIVPENDKLAKLNSLKELKDLLNKYDGYLFFSIGDNLWSVDTSIAAPRFFRDRYAEAFGRPERGDWKQMRMNEKLLKKAEKDNIRTQEKWKKYFKK